MSDSLFEFIARSLSWLGEFIFHTICYLVGWPFVKLLTLGRYPSAGAWKTTRPEAGWTCALGLTVMVVVMMAALGQFDLA